MNACAFFDGSFGLASEPYSLVCPARADMVTDRGHSPDGAADVALAERIRSGDRSAFIAFYDRYATLFYSVAMRILNDRKESEDVLQEVMLAIWTKSGDYDPRLGALSAWSVTLTRNKALDRVRARTRRLRLIEEVTLQAEDEGGVATGSANEAVQGQERAQLLRLALQELPAEQRLAIELAFFTGLSQADIAARLQQPLGTVKARIRRGMLRLRERLGGAL